MDGWAMDADSKCQQCASDSLQVLFVVSAQVLVFITSLGCLILRAIASRHTPGVSMRYLRSCIQGVYLRANTSGPADAGAGQGGI